MSHVRVYSLVVQVSGYVTKTTLAAALLLIPAAGVAQVLPELPRESVDTTYAPPSGPVITVNAGGNLQTALNNAQPGSIIELEAGATFSGNFTLPAKSGSEWIYIRSTAHASLPAPGTRVTPDQASLMPKIVTPNVAPALTTATEAHHYRFVGVEITTTNTGTSVTVANLVLLEASGQNQLSEVPHHIVFDRCYIHGTATGNVRRGIMLNSATSAVVDSYISDIHELGNGDTQAIGGYNGPGPYKIHNNHLEAAGENVIFGGADPKIPNLVPSDIVVTRNYMFKPLSWKEGEPNYGGIRWNSKNNFELKNAKRVLVEGNILENNWVSADQPGHSVLFTVWNQEGNCRWCTVEDVTFRNNIIRHTAGAFSLKGTDYVHPSMQTARILVRDNLVYGVDMVRFGSATGCCVYALGLAQENSPDPSQPGGLVDVTFDHNTISVISSQGTAAFGPSTAADDKHQRPTFTNNIFERASFGFFGTGYSEGTAVLNGYTTDWTFDKNLVIGASGSSYPPQTCGGATCYPGNEDAVGFVDWRNDDYRLGPSSPYLNAGTDGKDIGADVEAVLEATEGVEIGTPPPGSDPQPPAVTITAPTDGATVTGTITVTADASDNVAVLGVQFLLDGDALWAEDTTAPYSVEWDTTTAEPGSHILTARARDTVYTTTSSPVTVTVGGAGTCGEQAPFTGTPIAVPGSWQAEDFDFGCEAIAYHDEVAGNAGGQYRPDEDVDIIVAPGNATGYVVNNFQTGEWLEYTIDVAATGTYTIELHVSSEFATSRFHVEIDGTDVTGSVTVPHTGGWGTFEFVGQSGVNLTAGQHVLRIHAEQEYFNLDAVRITSVQSAYPPGPFAVPGLREAEEFDLGGQGTAYNDLVAGNAGGQFRQDEDVDIIAASGNATGYVVNNFETGEWLEYTLDVATSGTYAIELKVSSEFGTSRFHVEIDGTDVTGPITVPHTGWWGTFQFVGKAGVSLTAGQHVMRIVAEEQYFNLDAIRIWSSRDIGAVGVAGSLSLADGVYTVKGSGANIWDTSDSFHFVNHRLEGDGEIVVRLTSMQNTAEFAKAGVMIRESLSASSAHVVFSIKPNGGMEFMRRAASGQATTFIAGGVQPLPLWFKLVRTGSTITGSFSSDGTAWTEVGSTTLSIASNAYIGLVVCANNNTVLNTSRFDSVDVTP